MFETPAESMAYDWLGQFLGSLLSSTADSKGIKIIDFSEVPSDVLPVVVGVLGAVGVRAAILDGYRQSDAG